MSGERAASDERGVGGERARLFVALELPSRVRTALAGWSEDVAHGVRGLRVLAPETLHVTLCFLGWRVAREIAGIAAACEAVSTHAPVRLSVVSGVWLPPRRPRVLAARLEDLDGGLAPLQSALSASLQAAGFYEPEARPYLGHVTVARLARDARIRGAELPPPQELEFTSETVVLYRSRLTRAGARYEPQRTIWLGGGG